MCACNTLMRNQNGVIQRNRSLFRSINVAGNKKENPRNLYLIIIRNHRKFQYFRLVKLPTIYSKLLVEDDHVNKIRDNSTKSNYSSDNTNKQHGAIALKPKKSWVISA